MTPGALRSKGMSKVSPVMAPLPSMGCPRVSTTRPTMPSLTAMEAMRPVRFTVSPSSMLSVGPNNTAPTLSSSRFITMASMPLSNARSSPASALRSPYARTTPSLTVSTVPTSISLPRVFSSLSMSASCWRNIAVTSLTFMESDIILF